MPLLEQWLAFFQAHQTFYLLTCCKKDYPQNWVLDMGDVLWVLRKGSVKSCLKLFITLWVQRALLSYRHRRKLQHTMMLHVVWVLKPAGAMCRLEMHALVYFLVLVKNLWNLWTCKELNSCKSRNLKNLLGHYTLPHWGLWCTLNRSAIRPLRMQ